MFSVAEALEEHMLMPDHSPLHPADSSPRGSSGRLKHGWAFQFVCASVYGNLCGSLALSALSSLSFNKCRSTSLLIYCFGFEHHPSSSIWPSCSAVVCLYRGYHSSSLCVPLRCVVLQQQQQQQQQRCREPDSHLKTGLWQPPAPPQLALSQAVGAVGGRFLR